MFMTAGTLVGGILIPLICRINTVMAYFIPVATICLRLFIFILGYPSYVKTKTSRTYRWKSNGGNYPDYFLIKGVCVCVCVTGLLAWPAMSLRISILRQRVAHSPTLALSKWIIIYSKLFPPHLIKGVKQLFYVFPITALVFPFNVVVNGCFGTTMILQGAAM